MKKVIILALFGLFTHLSFAQISVVGEVRPRYEFRNGFKTLRPENQFEPASFIEQRTRLYFSYQKNKLKLHIAVQDIRMWGNHNQIYKADPALTNMFEAYAMYQLSDNWAIKLGRQTLSYDTQRFLGGLDWAQQGRSHDAVLIRYKNNNGLVIDGAFALNASGVEPGYLNAYPTPYGLNNYKNMQMIYATKKWDKAKLSVVFQNDGRTVLANDTSTQYRQTYGLIGNGWITEAIGLAGEFYYQGGINGGGQTVNALFANLQLTFKTKITPIIVGGDYASGTRLEDAGQDNAWNPLYGTNHKWYGFMDYFYVGNGHGQGGRTTGLIDLYLKTNFKLADKHTLAAHGHYFMSPVTIYDTRNVDPQNLVELGSDLGIEIDLVYKFVVSKEVNLQVGYSHLFATETMEAIKNGGIMDGRASNQTQNWAFIMIQFKPELLNTAKKQ
ncbi:MAG: alginate export family protein [Schleiferiaceae bacterium]|nr:alginate export family protein [Schleiferiaceae bacterium]